MSVLTQILVGFLLWAGFLILILPVLATMTPPPKREDPRQMSRGWVREQRRQEGRE